MVVLSMRGGIKISIQRSLKHTKGRLALGGKDEPPPGHRGGRAGAGHTVYRGLALAIIAQTTATGNTPRDIERIFSFQYTFSTPLVSR
ncbi:hypothetical protein Cp87MAT_0233 [Corynebacterium pseudotuberculosis]|nr:hypothetical protein Cp87MAT_0233 [Corynebacterium pseudotuberculosis]